jgi:3-oxoacyl-[acyl-carrier-protein] synthase II
MTTATDRGVGVDTAPATSQRAYDTERRRVVITGIGPITASGIGVADFWEKLHGRASPVRKITRFDASLFRSCIAAEVDGFEPTSFMERKLAGRLDLFAQLSLATARAAIDDAALVEDRIDKSRVAVQMGTALGGVAHGQDQMIAYMQHGLKGVDARLATTVFGGAASCWVAIEHGFTGPNSTNAMSCASGTIAVADGFRIVRDDEADVAICGGIEAPLGPLSYGAFAIIRAMSTRNADPERACRPFDKDRDGFVMGEGGCVLVLEELGHALARGARIYAEVRGYGITNDGYHMTSPRPDGSQAARAMTLALTTGGVASNQIDYVNAHASSTPLNDSTETLAIRTVLGERAYGIPVSGTKAYYGHALGASGAIEAGITALAIHHGWVPPTLNFESPGESCDLDYVPGDGRRAPIRSAISNSFGFGGINASLAMSAWTGAAES